MDLSIPKYEALRLNYTYNKKLHMVYYILPIIYGDQNGVSSII